MKLLYFIAMFIGAMLILTFADLAVPREICDGDGCREYTREEIMSW